MKRGGGTLQFICCAEFSSVPIVFGFCHCRCVAASMIFPKNKWNVAVRLLRILFKHFHWISLVSIFVFAVVAGTAILSHAKCLAMRSERISGSGYGGRRGRCPLCPSCCRMSILATRTGTQSKASLRPRSSAGQRPQSSCRLWSASFELSTCRLSWRSLGFA